MKFEFLGLYPLTDLCIALPKLDKLEAIEAKKPPPPLGFWSELLDEAISQTLTLILKKTQNCTYSTTNLFESDLQFKCNTNRSNQMDGEKWYREYMYAIYDYNIAERQLGRGVIFVGGFFLLFEVKNETMIRFSPSKLLLVKVVFWFLELSKAAEGARMLQCRPCAVSGKKQIIWEYYGSKNKNLLYSNIRFF